MYLKSGTRRSSRLQMLWSVLLQVRQIQPVQFQHHPSRVILQPVLSPAPTEDAVVIKYVNLGLSNGMKIEHHNLSYSGLQKFYLPKLQALCLA